MILSEPPAAPTRAATPYFKAAGIFGLAWWGVNGALHYEAFNFIHGVDLLIHEFGHLFCSIFGNQVFTVLGGSLVQIVIPLAFMVYFILQRQWYASTIVLFWVGQNFFDVAVYVRDARALQLPLVGIGGDGSEIIHDWNFLLDTWGILTKDLLVANLFATVGWLCLVFFSLAGLYFSVYDELPRWPSSLSRRETQPFKFIDHTR